MSSEIFPTLPGTKLDVERPVVYSTGVQESVSGKEFRALWFNRPRTRYRLNVEFLRSSYAIPEWQQLVSFYQRHGGRFDSFLFTDPDDYTVLTTAVDGGPPMNFGEGDGSTTQFQLQRTLSAGTRYRSNVLFTYTPGDSLTLLGATFTRASTAAYTDKYGVLRYAASGEVRDAHYIGSVRTLLLEGSVTNLCPYSQQIDQWTEVGTCAVTANARIAPDLTMTADLVTGGLIGLRQRGVTFAADGTKGLSFYVYPGTATSTDLTLYDSTAATVRVTIRVTWSGLAATAAVQAGSGAVYSPEVLAGGWYRIRAAANGVLFANTNVLQLVPDAIAGTGSIYFWGMQAEATALPTSYVPTTASTAGRSQDALSFPWGANPAAMTMYADFYDLTDVAAASPQNTRILQISNLNTAPRVLLDRPSGSSGYQGVHDPGVTTQTSAVTNGATFMARIECRLALAATGAPTLGVSVNSNAESTSSGSAQALATAWSSPTYLYVGPQPSNTTGQAAYRRLLVFSGVSTLTECRAESAQPSTPIQYFPSYADGYEPCKALNGTPIIYRNNVALTAGIDYTLSDSGLVTFTTAPIDGAKLGWLGSYYKRVRFDSDAWATRRMVLGLWDSPTLELVEVL